MRAGLVIKPVGVEDQQEVKLICNKEGMKSPAVVDDVPLKERKFLIYQKSVFAEKPPAANREPKLSWGSRLFGQNKENHERQKQSLSSSQKNPQETKEQKKLSWWKRFKNRSQGSSAPREPHDPEKRRTSNSRRHTRDAHDEARAAAAIRREHASRCTRLFRLGVERENTPRHERQSFSTSTNRRTSEKPLRCLRSEVIPTTLEMLIPERRCHSTFTKRIAVEVDDTDPDTVSSINPPKAIIRMPDGSTIRYTLTTIPEEQQQQNAAKRSPPTPPQHATVDDDDAEDVQESPTKSPRKRQIRFIDVSSGGSRATVERDRLQRFPSPHPRHKRVEFKDTGQVSPIESPKSRHFGSLGFPNPASTSYISPGSSDYARDESLEVELAYRHLQATLKRNLMKDEPSTEELCPSTSLPHRNKTPRHQHSRNRGLPNPAMFCYMNSCLQSLLTLKDFVRDIGSQDLVQTLIPETKLMRSFLDISKFHVSDDNHKMELLHAFKTEVALQNPEFCDHQQKDAHEFLIAVLEQMRKLGKKAVKLGQDYRCPVTKHMMFKMRNTRTCTTCGAKSERLELFSNLSLDLTPGATVKQLLNNYRREMELDYKCDCGACTSVQRSIFATLPKVLILQLKRFKFTEDLEVTKVYDNIVLQRELHLSSRKGAVSYMLVSCISHLSSSARIGHYICDAVNPDAAQADLADLWLTYDDSFVRETCSATVCKLRGEYAYILFYQRQD